MWIIVAMQGARAEDCTRVPIEGAEKALQGADGLAVVQVTGALHLVGTDGDTIRASGTACVAGVKVTLVRDGDAIRASVTGPKGANPAIELAIPRSIGAVTVDRSTGPVAVSDLPTRFAVVRSTGPIEADGVGSLRVTSATGPVTARDVHGDVVVDGVIGPVDVQRVTGDLLVAHLTGSVRQSDVAGRVLLP